MASQGLPFTFPWIRKSEGIILSDLRASPLNCSVMCTHMCDHVDPDVQLSLSLIVTKICSHRHLWAADTSKVLRRQKGAFIGAGNRYNELLDNLILRFLPFLPDPCLPHSGIFRDFLIPYAVYSLTLPCNSLSASPRNLTFSFPLLIRAVPFSLTLIAKLSSGPHLGKSKSHPVFNGGRK